jgi:hypothetical protein
MDKNIHTVEMTMNMLASHPSSCVTSWQAYNINGYIYYTKEKGRRSVAQNSGIPIEAFDPLGVKTTYYGYIQDIWELNYDARLQIPVSKCQWVKHLNHLYIYYLCNKYILFVTFAYLWKLYVCVCEINDHEHTYDEYLVLLAKSGMIEVVSELCQP